MAFKSEIQGISDKENSDNIKTTYKEMCLNCSPELISFVEISSSANLPQGYPPAKEDSDGYSMQDGDIMHA